MTIPDLLIVSGVMLLAHEIKPAARLVIDAALVFWGALFALGSIIF